ncbi:hypothetical protein I7I51_00719 [Histoplasma capsulatum]|uniref:Uncharacterized protein n=1 Tax=Ajellomyces capsulatus TaxID=5037 RepID=A0A8A1MEU3_AJECA|nr:hypothetical protein I7I51_00719 [Histoplasma capsulatum]
MDSLIGSNPGETSSKSALRWLAAAWCLGSVSFLDDKTHSWPLGRSTKKYPGYPSCIKRRYVNKLEERRLGLDSSHLGSTRSAKSIEWDDIYLIQATSPIFLDKGGPDSHTGEFTPLFGTQMDDIYEPSKSYRLF